MRRFATLLGTVEGLFLAGIALFVALPACALAQSTNCVALGRVPCTKPISISDRWDDVSGIPGYMGGSRRPDWRNNQLLDRESFTDANGDGLYQVGESYLDGNGNGVHDEELYAPWLTGYTADGGAAHVLAPAGDLGLSIDLHPTNAGSAPSPGQYLAIDLPPANLGTPIPGGTEYRWNWANCEPTAVGPGDWLRLEPGALVAATHQAMQDLRAADPDAYWDAATKTVQWSEYDFSPRVWFVTVYDPRMPLSTGANFVKVTKVLAFFLESIPSTAVARGRLLRVASPILGGSGEAGSAGGFIVECPVPARPTSWGHLKGTYR